MADRYGAILITGGPGAGKSSLAMAMVAAGWHLLADDLASLSVRRGRLWVTGPGVGPRLGDVLLAVRGLPIIRWPSGLETAVDAEIAIEANVERELLPFAMQTRERHGISIPLWTIDPGLAVGADHVSMLVAAYRRGEIACDV